MYSFVIQGLHGNYFLENRISVTQKYVLRFNWIHNNIRLERCEEKRISLNEDKARTALVRNFTGKTLQWRGFGHSVRPAGFTRSLLRLCFFWPDWFTTSVLMCVCMFPTLGSDIAVSVHLFNCAPSSSAVLVWICCLRNTVSIALISISECARMAFQPRHRHNSTKTMITQSASR